MSVLKNLNIHFFGAEASESGHKACYFVVRPFGNYLIFGLDRLPINPTFLMSKGGVYKQLFTRMDQLTPQGKKFFTTFGCSAVLPPNGDPFSYDPQIRFEIFGKDFHDKDLLYMKVGDGYWPYLYKQNDRAVIFPDEGLLIHNGEWKLRTKATLEQLDALQRLEVDVILPRLFIGASPYQAVGPEVYFRKIEELKNQIAN